MQLSEYFASILAMPPGAYKMESQKTPVPFDSLDQQCSLIYKFVVEVEEQFLPRKLWHCH